MKSPTNRSSGPLLPLEVIERIIGHSCDPQTLYNFSLTCRDLRPRSLCLLVSDAALHTRNQVFHFCEFLTAKPHLKPLVYSVLVDPGNFAPVPLLHMLPNLSEVHFVGMDRMDGDRGDRRPSFSHMVLNESTLKSCRFLTTHIQKLSLSDLSFATSLQFLGVLSAFTRIAHLVCSNAFIHAKGDLAPLAMAKRRLAPRLRLLTLTIIDGRDKPKDSDRGGIDPEGVSVGALLLHLGLVQSTIESLTVEGVCRLRGLSRRFNWSRLWSLSLGLRYQEIEDGIAFVKDFHHLTSEVTIKVHEEVAVPILEHPLIRLTDLYELERTLLGFPQAQLVWVRAVFPIGINSFWAQDVENLFPELSQRGALTVVSDEVLRTPQAPLRLPLEVIEKIIGHSCDYPWMLRNFSLTCRDLRPRSLCLLVANVVLHDRGKLYDFCDFLKAKPHLKPLVRSILVDPNDFAAVPLLRTLPHLSEIKFEALDDPPVPVVINQSSLTSCQRLGVHIQTLSLTELSFATSIRFLRMLSAFPSVARLVCSDVVIDAEGEPAPLDVARRRLSSHLRLLTTLTIAYSHYTHLRAYYDTASAGTLLLDSGLTQATVESLTVQGVYRSTGLALAQQFHWPRLRSLTLKMWSLSEPEEINAAIVFLKDFHYLTLKEVVIEVHSQPDGRRGVIPVVESLARHAELYEELEHTLLRFSQVRLVWVLDVFPLGENSHWVQEIETRFPGLCKRSAVTVVPNADLRTSDRGLDTLVVSTDSKFVASAPWDGSIALWDTNNGALVQRWIPYADRGCSTPLAFSPNSQYIVSGHTDFDTMVIWDLSHGSHQVLTGHTGKVKSCAWSPGGDVMASGSEDATVRLWDAKTFQPLHVLKHPVRAGNNRGVHRVEFSPNGRWLFTVHFSSPDGSYYVWNVASGTMQQLRTSTVLETRDIDIPIAPAFNPNSTHFTFTSSIGTVEILESDGGEWDSVILCSVRRLGREARRHLAVSPHRNILLTGTPDYHSSTHTMKIWDVYANVELLSLEGHKQYVHGACFSPCGKYVVSASEDGTVRLWRISDGSSIATFSEHNMNGYEHDREVIHVAFSPDGKTLVSGSKNGSVIIRQMCDVLARDEGDL